MLGLAGCTLIPISGCTTGSTPIIGLNELFLTNKTETAINANVEIAKETEKIHQEQLNIPSRNGKGVTGDWIGEQAKYSVTVSVPKFDLSHTFSTADANKAVSDWGNNNCYSLHMSITEGGISPAISASKCGK
jgi:hypothetical protein